jgi:hypothetical protein
MSGGIYISHPSKFSSNRTRMTRIAGIFTDPRAASASSAQSAFHRRSSAFIMPCGFSTPRTRMLAGIRGHALQRRDSGRHHLRLIFVSLCDRIEKPPRSQRTQRKRQSSVFPECSLILESLSRIISKCPFFLLPENIWRSL